MKKEVQKELEKLSSSLGKMERREGFKVPVDYFHGLADQVMDKVNIPKATTARERISLWDQLALLFQPRMAVAFGTVLALIVAGWWFFGNQSPENLTFADLSAEEAVMYVKENMDDFDMELFMELSPDEEGFEDFMEMEFEEDEVQDLIEEYIEDLDLSDLEDML